MAIYRVTKWYRVKEINYIRDNCKKLTFIPCLFIFKLPTYKVRQRSNQKYMSIFLRDPLKQISLSIDKELGKSNVSLMYHISMKIFRRGRIIRCWRFLRETTMVYSWVFWRYLAENPLWFSTIKPLKVSSCGLCEKIV